MGAAGARVLDLSVVVVLSCKDAVVCMLVYQCCVLCMPVCFVIPRDEKFWDQCVCMKPSRVV